MNDKNVQPDDLNITSGKNNVEKHEINAPEEPLTNAPEEPKSDSINHEISINFVTTRKYWNRDEIIVDNIFAYNMAL